MNSQLTALIDRLAATRSVRSNGGLCPCTHEDVERLEAKFSVTLPERYKEFLLLTGRGAGQFLVGNYWRAFYDDLLEIGHISRHGNPDETGYDLPEEHFVFCDHSVDLATLFFLLASPEVDPDPPVYFVGETSGDDQLTPLKVCDSFTAWLEEVVSEEERTDRLGIV